MSDHRFFRPYYTKSVDLSIGELMGVRVPSNVAHLNIWPGNGKIEWRTRNGKRHEMKWPPDGDITPIIVAMRMSC